MQDQKQHTMRNGVQVTTRPSKINRISKTAQNHYNEHASILQQNELGRGATCKCPCVLRRSVRTCRAEAIDQNSWTIAVTMEMKNWNTLALRLGCCIVQDHIRNCFSTPGAAALISAASTLFDPRESARRDASWASLRRNML